jgi:hypothetical protein
MIDIIVGTVTQTTQYRPEPRQTVKREDGSYLEIEDLFPVFVDISSDDLELS